MTPHERRWLLAAVAGSAGLRLAAAGIAILLRHDPTIFHVPDSARYLALGRAIAEHGAYALDGRPELFRLPGFPVLVAIATMLGAPTGGTIVIHALLGAVTTWLCFVAGRAIGGVRVGLWAATLEAIEPGQWAWSAMLVTEPLCTTFVIASVAAALRYLATGRWQWLALATIAAAAAAYERFVAYLLPAALVLAMVWIVAPRASAARRARLWRHAAGAAMLAAALLGAWHLRNGLETGYWGFSMQLERAAFFMGEGTVNARQSGSSYTDTVQAMPGHDPSSSLTPAPASSADVMRRRGLGRMLEHPFVFASSYAAGIATTLLHPGTAVVMRPFTTNVWDTGPASAAQMLTLGQWDRAVAVLAAKGTAYWLITIPLVLLNLAYLAMFVIGARRHWSSAGVRLACVLVVYFVVLSGGPDGDSRRRVPFVPVVCVIAATLLSPKTNKS
jgi:4-amino-4-deoxy-L-arabinose transferase-like glycosyltransferase